MSEFPRISVFPDPAITISTNSIHSINAFGLLAGAPGASTAWPVANTALFIPFRIARSIKFSLLFTYNGSTVSGNVDVGVYSADGTRIVSAGSTAHATTSGIQKFTVASTQIDSGLFYFGVALDNTTGTFTQVTVSQVPMLNFFGVAQMASAFPLPATATFASNTSTAVPTMGLSTRSFL
jgi:hypothetical protein